MAESEFEPKSPEWFALCPTAVCRLCNLRPVFQLSLCFLPGSKKIIYVKVSCKVQHSLSLLVRHFHHHHFRCGQVFVNVPNISDLGVIRTLSALIVDWASVKRMCGVSEPLRLSKTDDHANQLSTHNLCVGGGGGRGLEEIRRGTCIDNIPLVPGSLRIWDNLCSCPMNYIIIPFYR